VGVFAGMLPMFGLQTLIALALSFAFRGNKIIAVLGTWVSNPLTDIPIHLFNFQVGRWLMGTSQLSFANISSWQDLSERGSSVITTWLLGGITVGLITGTASYFLGLWLVRFIRSHRPRNRLR
jgi:uncharacterized protein